MKNILDGIIEIIYPEQERCAFCRLSGANVNKFGLCRYCTASLSFLSGSVCRKCGRPVEDERESLCPECKDGRTDFDGGLSVFEFTGIVKDMLHSLKYGGNTEIAHSLGKFMALRLMKKGWKIDMIMPVPLYPDKIRQRGYNQSYLISAEIGHECGIRVYDDVLIRKKNTQSQTTLTKYERMYNVRGAFDTVRNKIIYRRAILVVDDVMTTGATLNERSRGLKKNGAGKVYCITAACPIFFK